MTPTRKKGSDKNEIVQKCQWVLLEDEPAETVVELPKMDVKKSAKSSIVGFHHKRMSTIISEGIIEECF